jgi:ATP-binding cassette subfamily F protein uup
LLLAKLFAQPSNLLVMDEPTNDLDVETLELLEELLGAYRGTLLLVSHDRDFIDNVVTSTLVLEGDGRVGDYVGGYSDWVRQRTEAVASTKVIERSEAAATPSPPSPLLEGEGLNREGAGLGVSPQKRKLSYKDVRELELLPTRIETLEHEIAGRTHAMQDPAFFRQDSAAITAANESLARLQAELDAAYARWQALEG